MATGLDVVQKPVSGSSGCTDSWVEGRDRKGGQEASFSSPPAPPPHFIFRRLHLGLFWLKTFTQTFD